MNFTISLPDWAVEENDRLPDFLPALEDRMRAVLRFAQLNFEHQTGGPFAAGVFEEESGRPVVIAVNRVLPSGCSSAHAEIVTLSLAQKILGTFDLGGDGMPAYQLLVNARPCAMCFGSLPWSGIRSLVVAATGDDVERLTGFDEGPVHPNWKNELEVRGIAVTENILRKEACETFSAFGQSGQLVYNGRLGST
ncbi:MAG: nucleoside deaminase [Chloroflexota bacterium]